MFALLAAIVLLQRPAAAAQDTATARNTVIRRDTVTLRADSSDRERRAARRARRTPKRIPVTAEHLATAFRDPDARRILLLARAARMRQDSALIAYDATTYQRISAGIGLGGIGRDRLAFRSESATRVRWRRGIGAYVDVTGARAVVPIAGNDGHASVDGDISPIPYYPGSETLWIGASAAKAAVDENQGLVHPLAEGAEAYYTYESGDSVTFRLPDHRTIQLRELRVRPREPRWQLAVGSLWFDMSGGQLVRAAFRMAAPMDIVAVARDDSSDGPDNVPTLMKPFLFPMTAQVSAIGVEYGLFQGRFWLPRMQVAEGGVRVGVMRVPFKLEQRYQYGQVNGTDSLPPIIVDTTSASRARMHVGVGVAGDSARAGHHGHEPAPCDSTGFRTSTRMMRGTGTAILQRTPCDAAKLASSPDLPPSIYDTGDETSDGAEIRALVNDALAMGAQSGFAPQPLVAELDRPRYNRIEGLSLGGHADQILGDGYAVHLMGRVGTADLQPVADAGVSRSDLRRTLALTGYNRLVSASDWGDPLSFGSSVSAFLFGRDEAYYYRASGVELTSLSEAPFGSTWTWGLFAEQERSAERRTTFSLARPIAGFSFDTNVVATRGGYAGARTRLSSTLGLDPQGARLFTNARLEAARGPDGGYGRAALDVTASHGMGNGAAALTVAGGTSLGVLPPQRGWFLGGVQTVRGQAPGLEDGKFGNAFWLARAEVAHGLGAVRPVAFGDIGWAGDRTKWRDIGRPLSGVGVGLTALDGLVRMDLSRGIWPAKGWRVDAYLEGRI